LRVKIEKVVFPGVGLVKSNGKAIFVEGGVVPGDIVNVRTVKESRDYLKTAVTGFVRFSEHREKYFCRYGGKCGGCLWMGVNYDFQLQIKKSMLKDLFLRNAGIEIDDIDLVPSTPPYPYRLRARFKIENGKIGFYKRNSHELVEIKNCPVCLDGINRGIEYLSGKIKQYRSHFPSFLEVEIRYSPFEDSILFRPAGKISKKLKNIFLYDINREREFQNFKFGDNTYHLSINTFTQINPFQNEKVIARIKEFVMQKKLSKVIDLYGGFGNLSLPLEEFVEQITVVEENSYAVEDGRYFVSVNGIESKVKFVNDRVENFMNEPERGDLLILDPPRKGAKEVMNNIEKISPHWIIYLSCNPATLTRDVKIATKKGYKISDIILFDFFPYTPEIETMVFMEKG